MANRIKAFGFINPIVLDSDGIVLSGHGRLLAAKHLGLTSVPIIRADHLSEP